MEIDPRSYSCKFNFLGH